MHNIIDNRYSSTYYHQIILRKKYRLKMAGKVKLYLSNRISFKKASIILHKAENMEKSHYPPYASTCKYRSKFLYLYIPYF